MTDKAPKTADDRNPEIVALEKRLRREARAQLVLTLLVAGFVIASWNDNRERAEWIDEWVHFQGRDLWSWKKNDLGLAIKDEIRAWARGAPFLWDLHAGNAEVGLLDAGSITVGELRANSIVIPGIKGSRTLVSLSAMFGMPTLALVSAQQNHC